jgi:methionyl-tRNA formyltransferase
VPLVVTHRDDPGEARWYASVFEFSKKHHLHVLADPPMETLGIGEPDLVFSFYYRSMLPMALLGRARLGAFNLHGSLLPKYRGRAPLNWAILKGERETGVTLHEMVSKPDAGRIVGQQAVAIGPDDTALEVFHRMTDAAEAVLKLHLADIIQGKVSWKPNDLSRGSYFGRRRPEDGRIDWSRPAQEIHDLVRAVAPPFPGAFDSRMRVLRTKMTDQTHAGEIGPYKDQGEWFARCGDGKVLRLLEVEPR